MTEHTHINSIPTPWLTRASWRMEQTSNWCAVIACAAIPTSLALANIAMALAAICWLLSAGRVERWKILRAHPVAWLCAALFVWILIGATYTTGTHEEVSIHIRKYVKLIVAAALMGTLLGTVWRQRCMHAFFIGMACVLLTQYGEIFWDLPWAASQNQGWGVSHTAFGDYITQSLGVSFLLSISLWRALEADRMVLYRIGWAIVALSCVMSLAFLSSGRTGYALLFMVSLFVAVIRLRGLALLGSLVGLIMISTILVSTSTEMRGRIVLGYEEVASYAHNDRRYNSLGGRMENYRQSLQLIQERPWIGWGTGSFHGQACRVASNPQACELGSWHPHNQYFLFGIQGGLIAMGLFIAILLTAAYMMAKASPEQRIVGWVFLAILAIDSLFNSSLFSARESHFFTLFLVVVLSGLTEEQKWRVNQQ